MAAAPNGKHLLVSKRFYGKLDAFVEAHDLGMVFYPPYDLQYSERGAVQPDVFFISKHRLSIFGADQMTRPPDLIAEILSPTNHRHDTVTKATIYARLGVKEYWLLDPEKETIVVFALTNGIYQPIGSDDAITHSALLPGFTADPTIIFDWPSWLRS